MGPQMTQSTVAINKVHFTSNILSFRQLSGSSEKCYQERLGKKCFTGGDADDWGTGYLFRPENGYD